MKFTGDDRILRLKAKRFEITLSNCKEYILPKSIARLMAMSVKQTLHQSSCWRKITICCWMACFLLHGMIYEDCGS